MKTVRFSVNPTNGYYVCSEPGEQAGEYVPADDARSLAEALAGLLRAQGSLPWEWHPAPECGAARAALSAAGWPEGGES